MLTLTFTQLQTAVAEKQNILIHGAYGLREDAALNAMLEEQGLPVEDYVLTDDIDLLKLFLSGDLFRSGILRVVGPCIVIMELWESGG